MNEPKRRGRPPKELAEAMAKTKEAVTSGPFGAAPPDYHAAIYDEANRQMDRSDSLSAAQAYARRVWAGQSVGLSRHERVGRVRAAMEAQGLSMEGVELP